MSDYNDGLVPEPCLRLSCGFGQQYASVELGDGTGYVRVTDDLRSEHHEMKRWYEDVLKEALDENAKLRELVAQLIYCARAGNEDVFCYRPTQYGCGFDCLVNGEYCSFAEICDRAHELGVEADA